MLVGSVVLSRLDGEIDFESYPVAFDRAGSRDSLDLIRGRQRGGDCQSGLGPLARFFR